MATNPASSLKPGQKILALVDESHLLAAARAMNKSIDWLAVRERILELTTMWQRLPIGDSLTLDF